MDPAAPPPRLSSRKRKNADNLDIASAADPAAAIAPLPAPKRPKTVRLDMPDKVALYSSFLSMGPQPPMVPLSTLQQVVNTAGPLIDASKHHLLLEATIRQILKDETVHRAASADKSSRPNRGGHGADSRSSQRSTAKAAKIAAQALREAKEKEDSVNAAAAARVKADLIDKVGPLEARAKVFTQADIVLMSQRPDIKDIFDKSVAVQISLRPYHTMSDSEEAILASIRIEEYLYALAQQGALLGDADDKQPFVAYTRQRLGNPTRLRELQQAAHAAATSTKLGRRNSGKGLRRPSSGFGAGVAAGTSKKAMKNMISKRFSGAMRKLKFVVSRINILARAYPPVAAAPSTASSTLAPVPVPVPVPDVDDNDYDDDDDTPRGRRHPSAIVTGSAAPIVAPTHPVKSARFVEQEALIMRKALELVQMLRAHRRLELEEGHGAPENVGDALGVFVSPPEAGRCKTFQLEHGAKNQTNNILLECLLARNAHPSLFDPTNARAGAKNHQYFSAPFGTRFQFDGAEQSDDNSSSDEDSDGENDGQPPCLKVAADDLYHFLDISDENSEDDEGDSDFVPEDDE